MDRKELMKTREVMVTQQLVLDAISEFEHWKEETEEKDLENENNQILNFLKETYDNINTKNILETKTEYKLVILTLLKKRIDELKMQEDTQEIDESLNEKEKSALEKITLFLNEEYEVLYNKVAEL